ncbi:3-methyladenine DNA glycosylase 8-oxoguanine DNA glycosylase [Aureococcus anophagefferens]|nr:3-methyladenine DNA glycosylase 8-oxoguanine DNA glycosylase [Aureococcus anophagefferens]
MVGSSSVMRRSPRALVLLLALAWSDKRDELRELHRQHRQHRHRPGVDAAAGAPPAPESDVPHLRTRSQYIADALLRAPESAAPATPGAAAAAWRDQVEAHVAPTRDFFASSGAAPPAAAARACRSLAPSTRRARSSRTRSSRASRAPPRQGLRGDGGAVAHGNFSALAAPPGAAPGARFLAQVLSPDFAHGALAAARGPRPARAPARDLGAVRRRGSAVVLVRDPVDVVLSGFNYHARLPAPEAWLDWRGGLFANRFDYMHAHSTLLRPGQDTTICNTSLRLCFENSTRAIDSLRPAAPLVVSCTVGYFGHLVDNPNATYASLLRASSLGDGLRAEALRALVGSGDLLRQQLWVERALVDGSRHGPTFATMAGFYAPGQFAAVARPSSASRAPSSPATSATSCWRRRPWALRSRLCALNGVGPWSCDMYLIFHLKKADVLPLGDLGVRAGAARAFGVRGRGKNGALDMKKDADVLEALFAPYAPYRSLAAYYMWRVVDTAFNQDADAGAPG